MDLIIGSGVSGLSYAMYQKHDDFLILEKESEIGGYCRTIKRNGFVWDYSGHFFHFQDANIRDLILKGIEDELIEIIKRTKIKYKDLLVDYPFQKNIHQLSKEELIDCLYDLFTIDDTHYTNFQEMLYCKFGKSIAEKFLIPYNEKLYACDLNLLDVDAMGRFFPYAEKSEIIKNFKCIDNSSYNTTFVYPSGGAIEYIHSIMKHIDSSKLLLNSEVVTIDKDAHCVKLADGRDLKYDRLISTMPFTSLLNKASIVYDKDIYTWNQVLVFNLGFDSEGLDLTNHWLYFPEKKYCFYRVGSYSNIFGNKKLSLYVEIGFNMNEVIVPEEWLKKVLIDLKIAGIISDRQSLVDYESIIMNPAYVHINKESTTDVLEKKDYLAQYDIYSIGRYGSWTYCSIEDNIKEAKELVNKIR